MTPLTIHESAEDLEVRAHVARQTVNQRVAAEWEQFKTVLAIAITLNEYSLTSTGLRNVEQKIRDLKNEIYFEGNAAEIDRLSEEVQSEINLRDELLKKLEKDEAQIIIQARTAGFSEVSKLKILAPWRPQ